MQKSSRTGVAFAFLCLLLLGVMPLLANARPADSDGLTFAIWLTFWQLVAASPLYVIERVGKRHAARNSLPPTSRRRVGAIALLTGAMFGLSTYMYVVAAAKAGAVSMVIALQAYPLFAIFLEAMFQGKRRSLAEVAFTLLMIGALVYLTTAGTFHITGLSWWLAFALGIPLLWSIAHLLLKRILETMPVSPNQVTVSRLLLSGIFLILLQAVLGDPAMLATAFFDMALQRAAVVMGVAYYLELVLWFHAMRHIDVSLASSVTVPAPAVTILISVAILGEPVAAYQVISMMVVVLAMYGLLLAGRRNA